jgi:predicted Fe-Mo cluster-binding NifX family protein
MKIAVSSTGKELSSGLDPRFGRAAYFLVVDTDSMAFDVVENVQNLNLAQGAGIQAALTVVNSKVAALLTGNCGPKAFQVLNAAGIDVITGATGRVSDAIRRYLDGELKPATGANVEGHWI